MTGVRTIRFAVSPVIGARRTAFLRTVLAACALAALGGCSTSPGTWQRPGTTDAATNADMAACQAASAQNGYGSMGPSYRNYVIRCMQDKGYKAGM